MEKNVFSFRNYNINILPIIKDGKKEKGKIGHQKYKKNLEIIFDFIQFDY
jgi:hypothetical protein